MLRFLTSKILGRNPPQVSPPPAPGGDTVKYIAQNTLTRLRAKQNEWTKKNNLYVFALTLFENLKSEPFLNEHQFDSKENRQFIQDCMVAWNQTPGNVEISEGNLDELENIFSGVMSAIRHKDDLISKEDPILVLLKWDMLQIPPAQACFNFTMTHDGSAHVAADQVIQIDPIVQNLKNLYADGAVQFLTLKKRPARFVWQANEFLNQYFDQLLQINNDETSTAAENWGTQSVQQALTYYFDQRQLLFRIYASTAAAPLTAEAIEEKINKMRPVETYLKEMLARPQAYSTKIAGRDVGYDRMTKINAALSLYHKICQLPADRPLLGDPTQQIAIQQALKNGRLAKLAV